jgi:hypothetical protein
MQRRKPTLKRRLRLKRKRLPEVTVTEKIRQSITVIPTQIRTL